MSASRHTYVVTLSTTASTGANGGLCDATVLVYDGAQPAAFGSKKRAEEYADEMRRLFPKETYEVIKLR